MQGRWNNLSYIVFSSLNQNKEATKKSSKINRVLKREGNSGQEISLHVNSKAKVYQVTIT